MTAVDAVPRLVYLHGFRSSSQGIKATLLRTAIAALPAAERLPLWTPDLPHLPAAAIALVAWQL